MTDTVTILRPVPRWVRIWAGLTAVVAVFLVTLGALVTSHTAGMADPVWPTEPWYLVVNGRVWVEEPQAGFLKEHSHRAAGWIAGVMVSVLAIAAWASEPNRKLRWFGFAAIVFLLAAYGGFHNGMMKVEVARKSAAGWDAVSLPIAQGGATVVGLVLCLLACGLAIAGGNFGRWTRLLSVVAMIAVMIQGLLGGFRVSLNALAGPQLAAYHGTFAQVVFAVLASVVFLAAPRTAGDALSPSESRRLRGAALALPAAVFVQLVWGVWLRHMGSPIAQRLHVLTAFVVAGLVVWAATRALSTSEGRRQLGFVTWHLLGILAVQILLGVEGWMAKYAGTVDPATGVMMPSKLAGKVEVSAAIRTLHVVIGTALLASATVFALRVLRKPIDSADEPAAMIPRMKDSIAQFGEPVPGY